MPCSDPGISRESSASEIEAVDTSVMKGGVVFTGESLFSGKARVVHGLGQPGSGTNLARDRPFAGGDRVVASWITSSDRSRGTTTIPVSSARITSPWRTVGPSPPSPPRPRTVAAGGPAPSPGPRRARRRENPVHGPRPRRGTPRRRHAASAALRRAQAQDATPARHVRAALIVDDDHGLAVRGLDGRGGDVDAAGRPSWGSRPTVTANPTIAAGPHTGRMPPTPAGRPSWSSASLTAAESTAANRSRRDELFMAPTSADQIYIVKV